MKYRVIEKWDFRSNKEGTSLTIKSNNMSNSNVDAGPNLIEMYVLVRLARKYLKKKINTI